MKRILASVCALLLLLSGVPHARAEDGSLPDVLLFLLIGEDRAASSNPTKGYSEHGRADSVIILAFQPSSGQMHLVSIDRDLPITGLSEGTTKLCLVNYTHGPEGVLQAVNAFYGLSIPHYMLLDLSDIGPLVDSVGGIEVDVTPEEKKSAGLSKSGLVKLTGAQTSRYVARRDSSEATTDIGRNERQRKAVFALLHAVKGSTWKQALSFVTKTFQRTTTNMGLEAMLSLATALYQTNVSGAKEMRLPTAYSPTLVTGHVVSMPHDVEGDAALLHTFLWQTP